MASRLNAPRRSKKPTPSPAPAHNPKAELGDNSAAQEEWERIQLIRFVGQLDAADVEVEKAQGPYKAALASRSAIKKLAQGAGFSAEELKARREEMAATAGDNARKATRETKHRKWLGITSAEQQKMHLEEGTPLEARDELDWQSEGYKRGLRGRGPELPDGMDARFTQPFLKGHEIGWSEYLAAIAQNVPKPKNMTAQEIAEKAAAEFKADNPEIDVEAAARKLKNSSFMERSGPVVGDDFTGPDTASGEASASTPSTATAPLDKVTGGADDGFEATEEELAQQKARQAIVDAREGNTSGEDALAGVDVV